MPAIAFFLAVLSMGATLQSCQHGSLNVKVYYLSNKDGGLVRKQESELIPFEQAEGFWCMNKQDFDATVEFVRSCLDQRPAP